MAKLRQPQQGRKPSRPPLPPWPQINRRPIGPRPGQPGPAVIAEDETTTIVPKGSAARLSPIGAILLEKVGT